MHNLKVNVARFAQCCKMRLVVCFSNTVLCTDQTNAWLHYMQLHLGCRIVAASLQ